MLGEGQLAYLRDEPLFSIHHNVVNPEITYPQTTKVDQIGCIYIGAQIYMSNNNKGERHYQSEKEQRVYTERVRGSGYERSWRQEKNGGNDIITFQSKF